MIRTNHKNVLLVFAAIYVNCICLNSCQNSIENIVEIEKFSEDSEPAEINICFDCLTLNEVMKYEGSLGSKKLEYEPWQCHRLYYTSLRPHIDIHGSYFRMKSPPKNNLVFYERRNSDIPAFKQLIAYRFNLYPSSNDSLILWSKSIFHLGIDNFGYTPVAKRGLSLDSLNLSEVNDITLFQFKTAYLSVLSWLQENTSEEHYIKKSFFGLSDDKFGTYIVKPEEILVDDSWQRDFFLYDYITFPLSENIEHHAIIVTPGTHAPRILYAHDKRVGNSREHYYIRLSDMTFEIEYFPPENSIDNRYKTRIK